MLYVRNDINLAFIFHIFVGKTHRMSDVHHTLFIRSYDDQTHHWGCALFDLQRGADWSIALHSGENTGT